MGLGAGDLFDFDEQIKGTDTMDNFGFETKASGACPVRNAVREISWARGELRHWQFDDDYTGFARFDPVTHKNRSVKDGEELYGLMAAVSAFGHEAGLRNVGFPPATMEVCPARVGGWASRVFNAHNMPSDPELFTPWVGRMNDDLINALNTWRRGGAEMTIKFMAMNMPPTQSEKGGAYRDVQERRHGPQDGVRGDGLPSGGKAGRKVQALPP